MNATFSTIAQLAAWLDASNGTGDHETAMRVMKLSEEVGEVTEAYIGMVGQNPRKGVTHTATDVADELCDVIVTALVALHRFTDDPEQHLNTKLQKIADRAEDRHARQLAEEAEAVHADHSGCTQPHLAADGYIDCDGQPI